MILLLLATLLGQAEQTLLRSVEIWSEHPIAIDIEWVTIDEAGRQTITAKRMTAVGPPVPLEFTHGADRYVRFRYQGASPRTYSTSELLAARKLHVPDVLPGGELLLLVPPMTVRPAHLLVEGPRIHTVPLEDRVHASLSGLPAGDYRVIPVYEGGLKGATSEVTVSAAETTLLHMPPEQLGAVRIEAAREVCGAATEMGINALVGPNARSGVVTSREPRCEMIVGGLAPGAFEAFYRRERSQLGSEVFETAPQTISSVRVGGPRVTVEGRVTFNGKPVDDAVVVIAGRPAPGERPLVGGESKTDSAGYYSVALAAPGTFSAMVRRPRTAIPGSRPVAFVEGRNVFDFALTGGTIKVELTGWDERSNVQVRIQGTNYMMASTFSGRTRREPMVFEALPFGEYKVSVLTAGADMLQGMANTSPNARTVVLTSASPEATLTFDVKK